MVGVHSSIFGNVRDRRPIQGRATEQTALNIDREKGAAKYYAMRITLFPTHQEENIHALVPHQRKCDKKSEVLFYNLDQNIAVAENQTY